MFSTLLQKSCHKKQETEECILKLCRYFYPPGTYPHQPGRCGCFTIFPVYRGEKTLRLLFYVRYSRYCNHLGIWKLLLFINNIVLHFMYQSIKIVKIAVFQGMQGYREFSPLLSHSLLSAFTAYGPRLCSVLRNKKLRTSTYMPQFHVFIAVFLD